MIKDYYDFDIYIFVGIIGNIIHEYYGKDLGFGCWYRYCVVLIGMVDLYFWNLYEFLECYANYDDLNIDYFVIILILHYRNWSNNMDRNYICINTYTNFMVFIGYIYISLFYRKFLCI